MYAEPEAWGRLLDRLAVSAATFLRAQIDAGAAAVQLFDSWAGGCRPPTTPSACCPTRGRCSTGWGIATCRGSTSAWAPASCCR